MFKNSSLLFFGILLFAFFPLLPNRIKGLPVILFVFISIIHFIKNRKFEFNFKKVLLYSSLYLILIMSLFFTEDFNNIDKTLSTRLSLLVLPISFGLINTSIQKIKRNEVTLFLRIYFFSSVVYCLLILLFYSLLKIESDNLSRDAYYAYLTNEMWGISQHPIYASIFVAIAFFIGVKLFLTEKKFLIKIILILGSVLIIAVLLFLSRRSVFLGISLTLLFLMFYTFRSHKFMKIGLVALLFLGFLLIQPRINNRFKEIFNTKTFVMIEENNSASIRYGIYKCVFEKIKISPIIGYGVGDVQNELNGCYNATSEILMAGNYNSHNQYLSYLLSSGVFGLILLISYLLINFKNALKQKNLLYLSILVFYTVIMLFENILERQSGVILFSFFINFFAFLKIDED